MWPQRQRDSHNPRMPANQKLEEARKDSPLEPLEEHSADSLSIETDCRGFPGCGVVETLELSLLRAQVQSLVEEYCVVQSKKEEKKLILEFWPPDLYENKCAILIHQVCGQRVYRDLLHFPLFSCVFGNFPNKVMFVCAQFTTLPMQQSCQGNRNRIRNSTTSLQNIQKRNRS